MDLRFNFEAVNLKAVDVRVIKIFEDNILQFLQDDNIGSNNDYSIRRVGRRIAKKTIPLIKNQAINTGKWKAYSIDLSEFFKADEGAIYRIELSFKKEYSLYNCDNSTTVESDDYDENEQYTNTIDEDLREEQYWDNVIYNY